MNAPVKTASSELAISAGQTFWTEKQTAALRQLGVDTASNADLAVFFHYSIRTGLDPFARQIYMIEREGKQTIQTGIDGFRLIARRAVDRAHESLGYEETLWCGPDGKWVDVWLAPEAPAAAKVTVLRNGDRYPAVALYAEYVGKKRNGDVTRMWQTKGALMLAKCAEALALRKAFPQDLSGIYTADEMQQGDDTPTPEFGPPPGVDPATGVVEPEVVDGDVVEDSPHREPTAAQLRMLGTLMTRNGISVKADRLDYCDRVIGHPIESSKDLTPDEFQDVVKALQEDLEVIEKAEADAPADPTQPETE